MYIIILLLKKKPWENKHRIWEKWKKKWKKAWTWAREMCTTTFNSTYVFIRFYKSINKFIYEKQIYSLTQLILLSTRSTLCTSFSFSTFLSYYRFFYKLSSFVVSLRETSKRYGWNSFYVKSVCFFSSLII